MSTLLPLTLSLSILASALAAIGIGALAATGLVRLAGHRALLPFALGELGIIGLFALTTAGLLAHVFIPLGPPVGAVVLGCGLAGAIMGWPVVRYAALSLPGGRVATALLPALALAGAVLLIRGGLEHYDTGLYHLQTMLWNAEEPLVLGLANIHIRFGYNSALYVLSAMIAVPGPGMGPDSALASALTVNAVVGVVVFAAFAQRLVLLAGAGASGTGRRPISAAFGLGAAAVATIFYFGKSYGATPNTDIGGTLFSFYALLAALAVLETAGDADPGGDRDGPAHLLMLPLCLALAVSIKPTQAPLVLLVAVAGHRIGLVPSGLARPVSVPPAPSPARALLVAGVCAAAVLAGLWMARGTALSGCLLYPFGVCFPHLPWMIEPAVAADDLAWMKAWARRPGVSPDVVLADWSWLHPWASDLARRLGGPLVVATALLAAALSTRRWSRGRLIPAWRRIAPATRRDFVAVMAILALGLGLWFVSAPLFRYGLTFLFAIPLFGLAVAVPTPTTRGGVSAPYPHCPSENTVALALLALTALALLVLPATLSATKTWPPFPAVALDAHRTDQGHIVYTPKTGDQCFAAPRPCTPHFTGPHLRFERWGRREMITAPAR